MGIKDLREMTTEELVAKAAANTPAAKILQTVIPPVLPPDQRKPEFSVISCSPPKNEEKFKAMCHHYSVALGGSPYEVIRIADAAGIAEGYIRGIEQARGDVLVFSHDDAAPVLPIAAKLRAHLRRCDIVAGAGTTRLDGPAWFTAGPPHTVGQVLNILPDPKLPKMLTVYGVPAPLVMGIQAFDGFWFACNRDILFHGMIAAGASQNGCTFDPEMCPGFHLYDVDFSFRAYRAGLSIGVASDLSLVHASTGGYADPNWKPSADRWLERYGSLLPSHRPADFQAAGVQSHDVNLLLTIMDEFVEASCK